MENPLPSQPQNELPVYTPPLELDTPHTHTKSASFLFPLALIAIVIAAIAGLSGYTWIQSTKPEQVMVDNIPTVPELTVPLSPEPTMTPIMPDLTGDWDIYTGTEYTFKHPKNIKFDTDGAETGVENIRFHFMGQKQIDSGRTQTSLFDGYMFIVAKRGAASEKTAAEWAVVMREQSLQSCEGVSNAVFTQPQKVAIADSTGMQFTARGCREDSTTTYLNHNDTVYEITQMYTGDEIDQPQYEEITNQMLRGLKFL